MAAKAEGTLRRAARPDRPQVDTDGRKDRDMQNGEDALGEFLWLFKFQGNTTKPEIEDAGAAATLVADDGVGVGSDHGDTFGFALNREGSFGNGRRSLFCQSPRSGRRRRHEVGRDFFSGAAG